MRKKKGQISIGFHWIYVLIAGAIILLFFVGLVVRQKVVSEEKVSATVVQKLEGILTGVGVSEQTTFYTEIPELEINFVCDEDGYSDFSIGRVRTETPYQPIFTPERVKSRALVSWTLEWMMPFKIANYLYASAPNIRYYLVYDDNSKPWAEEIDLALPERFKNYVPFEPLKKEDYSLVGDKNDYKVRFIFLGVFDPDVPLALWNMADRDVTAVYFTGTSGGGTVTFYKKQGSGWDAGNSSPILGSYTTNNPNFYGAIFAENKVSYECNLRKVFRRMKIIGEIYQERVQRLEPSVGVCSGVVDPSNFNDMISRAEQCSESISIQCEMKPNMAKSIDEADKALGGRGCHYSVY